MKAELKQAGIRIPAEMMAKLRKLAVANNRSLTKQIWVVLEAALAGRCMMEGRTLIIT